MADALARTRGSVTSDRLQFALDFGPVMLELYFAVALRDVNERNALTYVSPLSGLARFLQLS